VNYTVTVRSVSGETTIGNPASVTVPVRLMALPQITVPASDLAVEAGKDASFEVRAIGGGTIKFVWERRRGVNWEALSNVVSTLQNGEWKSQLTINGVAASDKGDYRVTAANARSSALSTATSRCVKRMSLQNSPNRRQ